MFVGNFFAMNKRQKLLFPELLPATQLQTEQLRTTVSGINKVNRCAQVFQVPKPLCIPLSHVAVLDFYVKLLSRIEYARVLMSEVDFVPFYVAYDPPDLFQQLEVDTRMVVPVKLNFPESRTTPAPTVHVGRVTLGIWNDNYLMSQLTKF